MARRNKLACMDCKRDTFVMGEYDYYVHDEVWLKATFARNGILCIECLEKRLGRQLVKSDFTDAIINHPRFRQKSARLLERLNTVTVDSAPN